MFLFIVKMLMIYLAVASLIWLIPKCFGIEDDGFDTAEFLLTPVVWVLILLCTGLYFTACFLENKFPVFIRSVKKGYYEFKTGLKTRWGKRWK